MSVCLPPAAPFRYPLPRGALLAIACLVGTALLSIAWKTYALQVAQHSTHRSAVAQAMEFTRTVSGRRGSIVDRAGRTLALSVGVVSCAIDPDFIFREIKASPVETLDRLADILELSPLEYQRARERIDQAVERAAPGADGRGKDAPPVRFVWIRRHLSADHLERLEGAMEAARAESRTLRQQTQTLLRQASGAADPAAAQALREEAGRLRARAREAAGRWEGVRLEREYKRTYPQGRVAAHMLGFTDIDGNGLEGLERFGNAHLTAPRREIRMRRVTRNRFMEVPAAGFPASREGEADGHGLELSLDSYLQMVGTEELAKGLAKAGQLPGLSGCFVVIDPWTGDILAMGSLPDFDPNHPALAEPRNRRNDVIATIQEPGSVMKSFVYAQALEDGLMRFEERVDCSTYHQPTGGRGRRVIRDVSAFGTLSLAEALYRSSNVGAVKVAERLGNPSLHALMLKMGFGQRATALRGLPIRPGEPVPALLYGELPGIVRDLPRWNGYSVGSIPQGYEVAVTPLQMTLAYCAFANGGWLPEPRIVRAIRDADGRLLEEIPPRMRRRVFREDTAREVRDVLRQVVTQGTARRYANDPVYAIAGKTGTANLLATPEEKRSGVAKGPYSTTRHRSNFIGMAPHENPRLVVMVSIYNTTKMGGEASAPVGAAILRRSLEYLHEPASR